ncbi:TPA: hypothetical protein ACH3X3_009082 [Trebouxia sp. C0006]
MQSAVGSFTPSTSLHRHTLKTALPVAVKRARVCSAYSEFNNRQQADPGRRALLLQLVLTAAVAGPSSARDFIVPLDSTGRLPPGYEDLTRRLVNALQDSISADINGASENEVRRKADPAKGLVKDWVSKWRDDRSVRGSVSHDQLSAMLQQLGSYYQKNGSRSRMSKDVGGSLLDKLKAAEASLPPVETKKKGLFG